MPNFWIREAAVMLPVSPLVLKQLKFTIHPKTGTLAPKGSGGRPFHPDDVGAR